MATEKLRPKPMLSKTPTLDANTLHNQRRKKTFVLCFDGTGNKFSGTDADSNILKLYRMLDRSDAEMYTFYQPGIGTYITSHSMQTTSTIGKIRSWYMKAKDSAVGSSFAEHVMGGYKFLMRYYSVNDDLFFFGFSRGAYTARFLAEMLDHIGLLSAGNEELTRFAWKTYAKWASRRNNGTEEDKKQEQKLYEFMRGFRETFSRPVRRIRFLGLFDTVNSVPKFESAWMQRSKFPYTARSSAKAIRHAVSIDERRAKFRQDLISENQIQREDKVQSPNIHRYNSDIAELEAHPCRKASRAFNTLQPHIEVDDENFHRNGSTDLPDKQMREKAGEKQYFFNIPRYWVSKKPPSDSLAAPPIADGMEDLRADIDATSVHTCESATQRAQQKHPFELHRKLQDIEEVWFAGGHADIGGGWTRTSGEKWMLSHAPLAWMVHEADKAGLAFDLRKVKNHNCLIDGIDEFGKRYRCEETAKKYHEVLDDSSTNGIIHDCLVVGDGLPRGSVAFWNMMEYLPFRRMDLQSDGSWRAIRWPLPMGETRDIPLNAQIHNTVIKRMQKNPKYRPGNLIVGGGGRGRRIAPTNYGMGKWEKYKNLDSPAVETYIRKDQYRPEDLGRVVVPSRTNSM